MLLITFINYIFSNCNFSMLYKSNTLVSSLNDEINNNTKNYISITYTEAMYFGSRDYKHKKIILIFLRWCWNSFSGKI